MYFVQNHFKPKLNPKKNDVKKDAAAVFREACSIRRSTLVVLSRRVKIMGLNLCDFIFYVLNL